MTKEEAFRNISLALASDDFKANLRTTKILQDSLAVLAKAIEPEKDKEKEPKK